MSAQSKAVDTHSVSITFSLIMTRKQSSPHPCQLITGLSPDTMVASRHALTGEGPDNSVQICTDEYYKTIYMWMKTMSRCVTQR